MVKKVGTSRGETLRGTNSADTLLGRGGNDVLVGGDGNDILNGGLGNDKIKAGAGDDKIFAGQGNDNINGGSGSDTVVLSGNFADATITKVNGGYKIVLDGATTIVRNVEFVKFADGTVAANKLINEAPTTDGTQSVNGSEDVVVNGTVTATDANGDTLSYAVATSGPGAPAHGAVTIDASGNFTYTPAGNYNGTDEFTVTITDGNGGTATQVVTVNLAAVNDAPVVVAGAETGPVVADSGSILPNFSISDIDSTLGSGTKVTVTTNDENDTFGFEGDGASGVTMLGSLVLVDGTVVGTMSSTSSSSGLSMTITFNAAATESLIEQVVQAMSVDSKDGGPRDITVSVTDPQGTTSEVMAATVDILASADDATITLTNDKQIVAVSSVVPVTVASNVTVDYVQSVGIGNVDDVTLTISLSGGANNADILALSTTAPTAGNVANVGGYLLYNDGIATYTVGTVSGGTNGAPLVVTLNNDAASSLDARDFDEILETVIEQVKFDTTSGSGKRDIEFVIDGVGSEEATGSASVVVTGGEQLVLTTGADTFTTGVLANELNVFSAAAGTLTDNDDFAGGSTENDILNATVSGLSNIDPTIDNVEIFNIKSTGSASVLDLANVTNTDGHTMDITVTGDEDLTLNNVGSTFASIDAVDFTAALDVETKDGQSLSIIAGSGDTAVDANDASGKDAAITLDTDEVATSSQITLAGSADFTVTGETKADVDASSTTDSVTIEKVTDDIDIQAGSANLTIEDVDNVSLTINADAMADDTLLSVSGSGELSVANLEANLDLSNFEADSVDVLVTNGIGDGELSITLGAFTNVDGFDDFTVSGSASNDVVTINAAKAVTNDRDNDGTIDGGENVDIVLVDDADYVLNGLTADVDASGAAGLIILNTLASAEIEVMTGEGSTTFAGSATTVSIDATAMDDVADTITFGNLSKNYAADIVITALGSASGSTVDAKYLDGSLNVTTDQEASITLGANVSTFSLDAAGSSGPVGVDATGFVGTFSITGGQETTVEGVGSITIDANGTDTPTATLSDDYEGDLTVKMAAFANTTIIAGTDNLTVETYDYDGSDAGTVRDGFASVSVDAADMGDSTTLAISAELVSTYEYNANITVTNLGAQLANTESMSIDLSGNTEASSAATATLSAVGTGLADDATLNVAIGTHATTTITASVAAADLTADNTEPSVDYEVVIDGAAGNSLVLHGSADFQITGAKGNIDASDVTGNLDIELVGTGQTVEGGSADDTITLAADGVFTLTGNGGDDTFVFDANGVGGIGSGKRVVITELEDPGFAGGDVLDFQAFGSGASDTIEFIGTTGFTNGGTNAGTTDVVVRYSVLGSNVLVEVDMNNDGQMIEGDGDFQVQINGVTSLSSTDFLF